MIVRTALLAIAAGVLVARAQTLGSHTAIYDSKGILQPWTSWQNAIDREMNWYLQCPIEHGYPKFIWMTFMDGKYDPIELRHDTIPAMQNGMGIISYLKYYSAQGKKDARVLRFARYMGDYLVTESLTPDTGKYPRFTRSTGKRGMFPQPADAGVQRDRPYEIEPDKGGIAGYALLLLFEETRDKRYLDQGLQNARVLVRNMTKGDGANSPWPFRVDYRSGEGRGPVSGHNAYILRLFDKAIELGYPEFQASRDDLWNWIKTVQLPNLTKDATLWAQFFEDHDENDNRTAWAPLSLTRYLLEKREALDPEWRAHSKALIEFVNRRFTSMRFGVPVSGEQDSDKDPWGGILSTYGAVLSLYSAATGSPEYKGVAYQALNLCLYAVDDNGCPRDSLLHSQCGGWQEDAHTDKIHNIVDAIAAWKRLE